MQRFGRSFYIFLPKCKMKKRDPKKPDRAFKDQMPGQVSLNVFYDYFAAGAGAPGCPGCPGAPGAPFSPGVPVAPGAPGAPGAGAGAGAATFGGSAGFCSSAFLQPTTANENVTKKSRDRMIAKTFFINLSPPFNDFKYLWAI
jgi:hypothetical protein